MNKILCGERVLEILFDRSGLTFNEIFAHFFVPSHSWDRHMCLINCLRTLYDEGLIKVDDIRDSDIREFIKYCEHPSEWNKFYKTNAKPNHNKFRTSDKWRKLRLSLNSGLEYSYTYKIACFPSFGKPSSDIANHISDIFVLMPFTSQMQEIYSVICDTGKKLGLSVKRADEFSSTNPIMSDIWSAIYNAKLIVADCTGKNPNVFYEIGIAHTVGKQVVLLTQNKLDIPFDINHIRYHEYKISKESGYIELANSLEIIFIHCLGLEN